MYIYIYIYHQKHSACNAFANFFTPNPSMLYLIFVPSDLAIVFKVVIHNYHGSFMGY